MGTGPGRRGPATRSPGGATADGSLHGMTGSTASPGTGIDGVVGASGAASVAHGSSTTGATGARVGVSIAPADYSWTSSIKVPKAPFGWTKATVVPREPGRGASSMTWPPWSLTDCRAAAQSATR